MTADLLRQTYDAFPYESLPFPETHPDRLATIGTLFGVACAPVESARVLELGCASGGNLIPLAAALPHARFVGIDFSPVQIAQGESIASALGLANVRLEARDIMSIDEAFGTFDYIIAHGVYSWVSPPVQERVLALCARHLAPNGIAYVSFNALPGWAARSVVREAMRLHTGQFSDPAQRVQQGRAVLEFLAGATKDDDSAYAMMLRAEAEEVRRKPDYYVLHDHLEEVNEALYFHTFVERASAHRLRYLGDAAFELMFTHDLAPEIGATLERLAPDLLKREQFLDFVRNRTFRRTLLVHAAVGLERRISPRRVMAMRVASRAQPVRPEIDVRSEDPDEFRIPQGNSMTTARRATKAALVALAERWPLPVAFDEACALAGARLGRSGPLASAECEELASALLTAYAAGVVELHVANAPFVRESGARPTVGILPRWQAERGHRIANLRHQVVQIDDATRHIVRWFDGTRTREEIAAAAFPGASASEGLRLLEEALPQLARHALLVA